MASEVSQRRFDANAIVNSTTGQPVSGIQIAQEMITSYKQEFKKMPEEAKQLFLNKFEESKNPNSCTTAYKMLTLYQSQSKNS